MMFPPRVLVALSDAEARKAFSRALPSKSVETVFTNSVSEAQRFLSREPFAMVIVEDRLQDGSFRDMLREVGGKRSAVPVVVASHLDDQAEYLEAMKLGAFDFISAPYRREEMEWILEHALHAGASTPR
jgi:DNA-binding NtrC family response regulator